MFLSHSDTHKMIMVCADLRGTNWIDKVNHKCFMYFRFTIYFNIFFL